MKTNEDIWEFSFETGGRKLNPEEITDEIIQEAERFRRLVRGCKESAKT